MVDHKKVEQAIRLLLEGIGEDPNREGLAETPDRIARALTHRLSPVHSASRLLRHAS